MVSKQAGHPLQMLNKSSIFGFPPLFDAHYGEPSV